MKKIIFKNPGTTLLEIVFYFAILGMFLSMAMIFAFQISNVSLLSGNMSELDFSSGELSKLLTESIQKAESVDTAGSVFDQDTGVLSLNMADASLSPTVISLSGGDVFFKEGTQTAIQVNSPFVTFSQLRFHHITSYKNPDQIVIDALSQNINTDISNINHQETLHQTISLRIM